MSSAIARTIAAMALLAAICAQTRVSAAGRSTGALAEIPIQLIGNHIYTQARVNGSGPYLFIIDTGGVNLVTPALRASLQLPALGKEAGHGVGAKAVNSGITQVRELRLGNKLFTNQKFFVFDLDQLFATGGVHMKGMVGFSVFSHFVTRINFASHEIELFDPESFKAGKNDDAVPLTISNNELLVPGSFDGIKGTFQIDTGSASTLTLNAPFVAAKDLRKKFPHGLRTAGAGVGGAVPEYTVRGRDLKIGRENIANPVVQLSVAHAGVFSRAHRAGVIGIGALKRYIVTFDFSHRIMYLRQAPATNDDLDTYDRSGISLSVVSNGFRIDNVVEHSPASDAGLRIGTVIESINGRPANSFSLSQIRELLRRAPPGTVISLGMDASSGAGMKRVKIILRKLI